MESFNTSAPDDTGNKQALTRFKPGQSGNPKGRPKGSRSKLSEDFLSALCQDFETHGENVITSVRLRNPDTYLKIVAAILPSKLEANLTITHELSEEFEEAASFADAWRVLEQARERLGARPMVIEQEAVEVGADDAGD